MTTDSNYKYYAFISYNAKDIYSLEGLPKNCKSG